MYQLVIVLFCLRKKNDESIGLKGQTVQLMSWDFARVFSSLARTTDTLFPIISNKVSQLLNFI